MPAREALLLSADQLLSNLPALYLEAEQSTAIRHGMPVRGLPTSERGEVKLYDQGQKPDNARFIGLGEVGADGVLRSKRLLATA
ncbi:tRNA pseudouridine(55) synthase TruB [Chitinibacter sp. ZOR0017]